jgi:hypothetical protein
LASGCSGHTLTQAVDLGELEDVVVGGSIDGRVKLLVVIDLATSDQVIFLLFILVWLGKFLVVKRNERL